MIFENTLEDELCSMIPSYDYQYSISLTSCQDVVCIELYTYGQLKVYENTLLSFNIVVILQ